MSSGKHLPGIIEKQRGSILVFVLVFAIVIGAAAGALIAESNAGLKLRQMENKVYRTMIDCINGLDIARNAIETSEYDSEGHNLALWSIDSTADSTPGADFLVDNDRVTVTVSYMGNFWYELVSSATSSDGEITRRIKQRVREKDFFMVKGDTDISEISDELNIQIEEDEDYQTVGGLISFKLGKIPKKNDRIEIDGHIFEVVEMEKNRIKMVKIRDLKKVQ